MAARKKGAARGRPPVTGTTRTRSILMRVTDAELERLQRAADAAGEPLTTWVRQAALRAARRGG
jgi:uncharacterized protein (DUF1778 family)